MSKYIIQGGEEILGATRICVVESGAGALLYREVFCADGWQRDRLFGVELTGPALVELAKLTMVQPDNVTARNLLANELTKIDGDAPLELVDCAARAAMLLGELANLAKLIPQPMQSLGDETVVDRISGHIAILEAHHAEDLRQLGEQRVQLDKQTRCDCGREQWPHIRTKDCLVHEQVLAEERSLDAIDMDGIHGPPDPTDEENPDYFEVVGHYFEVVGQPLSDITPGTYDLQMRDGRRVRAWVDVLPGVGPWWSVAGKAPSDDWRDVVGAIQVAKSTVLALAADVVAAGGSLPYPGTAEYSADPECPYGAVSREDTRAKRQKEDSDLVDKILDRTCAISVEHALVIVGRKLAQWRAAVDELGKYELQPGMDPTEAKLIVKRDAAIMELFGLVAP